MVRASARLAVGLFLVAWVEAAAALAVAPSWAALERALPSLLSEPLPVVDATLHPATEPVFVPADQVVLYRERNGWCPYSERAWLALELKGASYATVLIDNTGGERPPWFSGTTPRIKWADGTGQGESMDIVRVVDDRFAPKGQLYEAHADVDAVIRAFALIFPRNTSSGPSSRAAFLFRNSGPPVARAEFEATLEKTNALIEERGGPFLCGATITAADVAWAPFLERYAAQLPLLHDRLRPRDPMKYPALAGWYDVMERRIPAYFARVRGDAPSWAKVLAAQGYGNGGHVPELIARDSGYDDHSDDDDDDARAEVLWRRYAWDRDGLGRTPAREAATRIVRNREAILKDADRAIGRPGLDLDQGLRAVATLLLAEDPPPLTDDLDDAAAVATYLVDRICVPRDMGAPPAKALRKLHAALVLNRQVQGSSLS